MAKNPLYRNEFYFFSNMYDDSLLTSFYKKISRESYSRSIMYQQNMLGRKRYSSTSEIFYQGKLEDLVIDIRYNSSVGLAANSRTLKFNTFIVPYHNKKRFYNVYGSRYQKIPLIDFFKRPDIFDKSVTLQIGKYRIMDAYIIQNPDKTARIAINNSSTDGITSNYLNKIFTEYNNDEPIWVFTNELSRAYYASTSFSTAVKDSTTPEYSEVTLAKSSAINNISSSRVYTESNSWDCIISYNSTTHGRRLMVTTPCSLKSAGDKVIFMVKKVFMNSIRAGSANFNVYFIHRPNRKQVLLYKYDTLHDPILNLDYTENPTGNINLEIFEINSSTMCKGRKLYDPAMTQVYFPNIFNFLTLNKNKSDLMIEITEYNSKVTNQIMNNSLTPLITSLGSDVYTEYIVNDHDRNLNGTSVGLKTYHPLNFPIDANDYLSSEYFGDIRGYFLDKIVRTIESDPYLISSYYEFMHSINKRVITDSGTPKRLRFGTGGTGEFSGSNPIVTDTSNTSATSGDIQYFSEPHSYFTYYTSMNETPSMVYLNGKYVRPTCHRFYKGNNYIYFPVNVIKTEISKYKSDAELLSAAPITIDVYPDGYLSFVDAPKDQITIMDTSSYIQIFQQVENPLFSLNDIEIYDSNTGDFLGSILDVFNIILSIQQYEIDNPIFKDIVALERAEDSQYLLTVLGEIYQTMDLEPIIIGGATSDLVINDFIDDMISEGIISEDNIDCFTNKKLNFKNVNFVAKDPALIGKTVSFYVKSFKQEYILIPDAGNYDETSNLTKYIIEDFLLDSHTSRYLVFVDGCLEPGSQIVPEENKYASTIQVSIPGDTTKKSQIILVHSPVDYKKDSYKKTNRVFYMKPAVKTEIETDLLWPEDTENGIILQTLSNNICYSFPLEDAFNIKFTGDGKRLPPSSNSTYSIYRQYYDHNRAHVYDLYNNKSGTVLFLKNDYPILKLALQNPYSDTFDEDNVCNPLDVLTYHEIN